MERYAGQYEGQQYVGMHLHRRRSVLVRTTDAGELLEAVQIANSPLALAEVMTRAGEHPEVVLEATYGWYWATDTLAECGAATHLAHPLGVKAFEYRRVKNDRRDTCDLADLLRMGRLPEAWVAPPATRELRALVRHRAKLVAMRSRCKAQVHAVLAKCGVAVPMSDLFGVAGTDLLDNLLDREELPAAYAARIASLRRVMDLLDFEIDVFARLTHGRLARDPGYVAVQTIPGIGPVLGAVLVAEIGDIHRFPSPEKLTCWAGMTPLHRESDTTVRRGRITKMGCGGRGRGLRLTGTSRGGPDAGCGWARYSSPAVDVRLRGHGQRGDRHGADLAGGSGVSAGLAGPVRRPPGRGLRAGGVHRVAVRGRGAAAGGSRGACRRAGGDRRAARAQAQGQDRPHR